MTKQKSFMLAMAGAALALATQSQAQVTGYANDDLLLLFRPTTAAADAGAATGTQDAVVDLGNVASFASTVAALPGHTAVLDTGSGYTATAGLNSFSGANLITALGANSAGSPSTGYISMSAAASDDAEEVWLTRQITLGQTSTGGTANPASSSTQQAAVAQNIDNIGTFAQGSSTKHKTFEGTAFSGAVNGALELDAGAQSYHANAADSGNPSFLDYQGNEATAGFNPLEASPVSGTVYEALWDTPLTGNASYLGFFTFDADGEVDFTEVPQVSPVPEPATYGMIAGLGLATLALRRQVRSFIA